MRMLSAAAVVVLLTAPAYAQTPNINLIPELSPSRRRRRSRKRSRRKPTRDP